MLKNKENTVTCIHCKYFKRFDSSVTNDFFKMLKGDCVKRKIVCSMYAKICDSFVLISGYYTDKYYPKK